MISLRESGTIIILPRINIIVCFYRIPQLVKFCALSVPESRHHQQQEERCSIRRQQMMEMTQRHRHQFLQLKERQTQELGEQKKRHKQELEDLLQRLSLRRDLQERRHGSDRREYTYTRGRPWELRCVGEECLPTLYRCSFFFTLISVFLTCFCLFSQTVGMPRSPLMHGVEKCCEPRSSWRTLLYVLLFYM